VRVPLWQRPSLHLQRSVQVARPPTPWLRFWFQPAARAIRSGCRRQALQHMLQQAPKIARLSGLSMWWSWCATVGQIVGSSAPPEMTLPRFVPVIKGSATVTLISKRGGMSGIEVLCLSSEAARLRPAFPTPTLGPRRGKSHRLGFLRIFPGAIARPSVRPPLSASRTDARRPTG